MKAYLAAPIFTERDRLYNSYLESEILKRCPDMDLYLAQNNASINDKTGCATSADIYVGDVDRLKNADLLITIMSGDLPPIGSSYEVAYFCGLCEQDPRRRIVALYDDSREASHTYSEAKKNAMISGIAENQFPYINLLSVGFVKKWGNIYNNSADFLDAIEKEYNIGFEKIVTGIYKITNLKNGLSYIGQSVNIYDRWLDHKNCYKNNNETSELYNDIQRLGLNYFKFEILEKTSKELLNEREKYWINYYDSYNNGYNKTTGGSGDKTGMITAQMVPVHAYNLDGTYKESYDGLNVAARATNLSSFSDISRCATYNDSNHKSGNLMWRFYKTDAIEPYTAPLGSNSKTIYAYDLNTRLFIKEYPNAQLAGEELTGKRQAHICDVANGSRLSCCGLIWAYDYFDRLPDNYFKELKNKE